MSFREKLEYSLAVIIGITLVLAVTLFFIDREAAWFTLAIYAISVFEFQMRMLK